MLSAPDLDFRAHPVIGFFTLKFGNLRRQPSQKLELEAAPTCTWVTDRSGFNDRQRHSC